ncbi:D-tyrosyl-tRNA(Tyr) deacylase [bacterium]|nr:D-tyrosyl-tRNA(Tyr) deacylase [bacterium]
MKALIQRVKKASVTIDGNLYSEINEGILIFVGVEKEDEKINAEKLADKILNLRIFEDENEKMNFSVRDVAGEILVVSQFTLCGDCKKGTRPSFDKSAPLDKAVELYEYFVDRVRTSGLKTETGKFRAMMDVELVNDGPVTFWVEK